LGKWNAEKVTETVRDLDRRGVDLSYRCAMREHGALCRAAVRYCGSWRKALVMAGIRDGDHRLRKRWSAPDVLAEIGLLAATGADLSWTAVAQTRPDLAAAATRGGRFGSWRAALRSAGLDDNAVCRKRRWDRAAVADEIRRRLGQGLALNAGCVEREDPGLLAAGRRLYGSWRAALDGAGLDSGVFLLRVRRSRSQ